MTQFIHPLRNYVRQKKNDLIQRYFQMRIYHDSNPYQLLFRASPLKFLVILGHMRSGSSLLSHILVSNPEIIGYGESHIKYQQETDLKKLLFKVYWRGQQPFNTLNDTGKLCMGHQYILDKILHDSKIITPRILCSKNIYCLFLIRNPERTLPSMLDLKTHWDEAKAVEHYIYRLKTLAKYSQIVNNPQRSLFLTYGSLVQHSNSVLKKLQIFLKTKVPFFENYQLNDTTGMPGVGDHKGNIKAGRIIRTERKLHYHLSPENLVQCQAAFDECRACLNEQCQILNISHE